MPEAKPWSANRELGPFSLENSSVSVHSLHFMFCAPLSCLLCQEDSWILSEFSCFEDFLVGIITERSARTLPELGPGFWRVRGQTNPFFLLGLCKKERKQERKEATWWTFRIFFIFCSGRGKGESEAPGGGGGAPIFWWKSEGGGGPGGAEGPGGCVCGVLGNFFWGGGGAKYLNFFFSGPKRPRRQEKKKERKDDQGGFALACASFRHYHHERLVWACRLQWRVRLQLLATVCRDDASSVQVH